MGQIGWHWQFDDPLKYVGPTYMYQDTAGTTPVTAVGQGIGLLLGREYGGARGVERVTNSDNETALFTFGSRVDTGVTISRDTSPSGSGFAAKCASSSGVVISKQMGFGGTATVGASDTVEISGRCYVPTGGISTFRVFDNNDGSWFGVAITTKDQWVSFRAIRPAKGSTWTIGVGDNNGSTISVGVAAFWLDDFSVKPIPGTHLTQATGTAKPTLSARVNLLLNTATLSTQNVTTLAAGYRLRFEGTGTVTLSGTVTAGPLSAGTHNVTATAGTLTLTVSGSVTLADLRTADDAAKNLPAYQRVGATATDHDTDGFPHAQTADGTDDSGTTATGGGNTTGFFYCGALTVSGGAGTARTIWSDTGTNTGYRVRINSSNKLELAAGNGTAYTTVASNETITAPGTYLLSAWDDGGVLAVQVNNFAPATTTRPSVSAGTSTITVYKDNGAASSYFNGRDYGSVYAQRYIGESAHNRLKRYLANVARITV